MVYWQHPKQPGEAEPPSIAVDQMQFPARMWAPPKPRWERCCCTRHACELLQGMMQRGRTSFVLSDATSLSAANRLQSVMQTILPDRETRWSRVNVDQTWGGMWFEIPFMIVSVTWLHHDDCSNRRLFELLYGRSDLKDSLSGLDAALSVVPNENDRYEDIRSRIEAGQLPHMHVASDEPNTNLILGTMGTVTLGDTVWS